MKIRVPKATLKQVVIARAYYAVRGIIPRWMQVAMRRKVILKQQAKVGNVWPIDPAAGSPPPGWRGWPEGKKFALVITHDVETQRGCDRCLELASLEEERGFRSSFNFVIKRYDILPQLLVTLKARGFEIGSHGLYHDGKKFNSWEEFTIRAVEINRWLMEWGGEGFRSPAMHCNLDWIHGLDITYDLSTFDTDPFEPKSCGVGTIFPFRVEDPKGGPGYVEMPYTLPQDYTLFILMGEDSIKIWEEKLDWVVEQGGMVLINVHPDYMHFGKDKRRCDEYPVDRYLEFLDLIKSRYEGLYWQALPRETAAFWNRAYRPDN